MSIVILLIATSAVNAQSAFAEPQIEVGNGVFNDEENTWIVNITGSGFYPDYESYIYLIQQDLGYVGGDNIYTDQNGDFTINVESSYGHLESGDYTVEIRELKIYEFEEYIEFGSFPENSIEWTISPSTTTEVVETIFEINGVVNLDLNTLHDTILDFSILDLEQTKSLSDINGWYSPVKIVYDGYVELNEDGSFRIIELVSDPPVGEHQVITSINGLVRYETYTVIPAEIIPVEPDTVVTGDITLSIDKSTYYLDDTVLVTGNLVNFDVTQSIDVIYSVYYDSRVTEYRDVMDDNGNFEILIPTDNFTGSGFGTITITIQNNDASIDFYYIDTPDWSNETLYEMIMTNVYSINDYNGTMTNMINLSNLLTDIINEQSQSIIDLQTEVNGLKDLVQGEAAIEESSIPVIDNFTVLTNGDNSITLSWIIHGEPITKYNLIYREEIGSWTTEDITETNMTSYTVYNLENIEYEFKFSAENESGESKKTVFSIIP